MTMARPIHSYPCGCFTYEDTSEWSTNPSCRIHNQPEAGTIVICQACSGTGRDCYKHGAVCDGCKGAGKHRI